MTIAEKYSRVTTMLVAMKWLTLLGSIAISWYWDNWSAFWICFLSNYGSNLEYKIRRRRKTLQLATFDKTFDEKAK